jgi:hypothetical protein
VRKEVEIERKKLDLESPVTPVTPVTPTELEPKLELKPEIKSE